MVSTATQPRALTFSPSRAAAATQLPFNVPVPHQWNVPQQEKVASDHRDRKPGIPVAERDDSRPTEEFADFNDVKTEALRSVVDLLRDIRGPKFWLGTGCRVWVTD